MTAPDPRSQDPLPLRLALYGALALLAMGLATLCRTLGGLP
ncbi:MAG: hypothetical protein ACOX2L_00620 [Anaerolineae bacterium]